MAYRPGQRLDARDLGDDVAIERALRAAHVSGVHRACGVACGFEIALAPDRRSVTVSPGLAYDGGGEELVLAEASTLTVPAWTPEGPGKAFEVGIELYLADGGLRARVRWTLALEPTHGVCGARPRRILLAVLAIGADGVVLDDPGYAKRPVARTDHRPAITFGTLAWKDQQWAFTGPAQWVKVDTSAAGFTSTPIYFVRFAREPDPEASVADLSLVLLSVEDPKPASFKLNAIYLAGDWRFKVLIQHYKPAEIEWIAVQPFTPCSLDYTRSAQ